MFNPTISHVKLTNPAFVPESVVDGLGVRLYIGMQECLHNCKGCINYGTHDVHAGRFVDITSIKQKILMESEHIDGVTFSGGESLL